MLKKLKNKIVQISIVMSGLFTASSGLTSCGIIKSPKEKGVELVQKRNPTADTISAAPFEKFEIREEYAERRTDSTKIMLLRKKYQFQLAKYRQALDSLQQMQQSVDSELLQAAAKGDLEGVKTALENGANVNVQSEKTGNTALMNAIEHSCDAKTTFDMVMYLLGEPNVHARIENHRGISAVDLVKAKLNSGKVEWETIMRKFNEATTDTSRPRGNSEVDKLTNQVEQAYKQLLETYGKDMRAALGYIYIGKNVHQDENGEQMYVLDGYGDAYPMGIEITTNEDGSKDTTMVTPYAVHPTVPAKLLLPEPKKKHLAPEEISRETVYKNRRKNCGTGHRYHRTVQDEYTVTTTRDGQQHWVRTREGR